MDNYSNFVGTNVRKLRDRLGMTQNDLAEASGISREQISRIENGKEKIISTALRKIAAATRVDVRQLMSGLDSYGGSILGEDKAEYGSGTSLEDTQEALWHLERLREIFIKSTSGEGAGK